MRVENFMKTEVVVCHADCRLAEAAKLMWEHDVGFLPVIDRGTGQLAGVITDRDALMAAYTQGKTLWEIPVEVAMAREVKSIGADAQIEEAEQLMGTHRIRRLPVLDAQERVVGIFSLSDVARWAAQEGDETTEQEVAVALGTITRPRAEIPPLH